MKTKIIPNSLLNCPENPGCRWDARYLMVVADLLNPELPVPDVVDLIMDPEDKKHRIAFGDIMRAASTESAADQLAAKFGVMYTPRIAARVQQIFQEMLRRHRVKRQADRQDIDMELVDLDRRFGAQQVAEALLAT